MNNLTNEKKYLGTTETETSSSVDWSDNLDDGETEESIEKKQDGRDSQRSSGNKKQILNDE
jgi:hypothetical protein